MVFSVQSQSKYSKNQSSVARKATNKYWNTGIVWVALKATGVLKSDPKIWQNSLQHLITAILPLPWCQEVCLEDSQLTYSRVSCSPSNQSFGPISRHNNFRRSFHNMLQAYARSFSLLCDLKLCKSILSFHGGFNSALGGNCCQTATFVARSILHLGENGIHMFVKGKNHPREYYALPFYKVEQRTTPCTTSNLSNGFPTLRFSWLSHADLTTTSCRKNAIHYSLAGARHDRLNQFKPGNPGILTYLPDKPLAAHGIIVNEARPEDKLERAPSAFEAVQVGKSLHVRWIQTLSKQE